MCFYCTFSIFTASIITYIKHFPNFLSFLFNVVVSRKISKTEIEIVFEIDINELKNQNDKQNIWT
jgi:hypothetical protein